MTYESNQEAGSITIHHYTISLAIASTDNSPWRKDWDAFVIVKRPD